MPSVCSVSNTPYILRRSEVFRFCISSIATSEIMNEGFSKHRLWGCIWSKLPSAHTLSLSLLLVSVSPPFILLPSTFIAIHTQYRTCYCASMCVFSCTLHVCRQWFNVHSWIKPGQRPRGLQVNVAYFKRLFLHGHSVSNTHVQYILVQGRILARKDLGMWLTRDYLSKMTLCAFEIKLLVVTVLYFIFFFLVTLVLLSPFSCFYPFSLAFVTELFQAHPKDRNWGQTGYILKHKRNLIRIGMLQLRQWLFNINIYQKWNQVHHRLQESQFYYSLLPLFLIIWPLYILPFVMNRILSDMNDSAHWEQRDWMDVVHFLFDSLTSDLHVAQAATLTVAGFTAVAICQVHPAASLSYCCW